MSSALEHDGPPLGLDQQLQIALIIKKKKPIDLLGNIKRQYPGASVSAGHLSDVLNGKVARPHPKVLVPILLVLDLTPEDVGITPATDWVTWSTFHWVKEHGWPNKGSSDQGKSPSTCSETTAGLSYAGAAA